MHINELHHRISQDCAKERAVRGEACGVHKDGVHKDGGHIPNCETSSSVGPSALGMDGGYAEAEMRKRESENIQGKSISMHVHAKKPPNQKSIFLR